MRIARFRPDVLFSYRVLGSRRRGIAFVRTSWRASSFPAVGSVTAWFGGTVALCHLVGFGAGRY